MQMPRLFNDLIDSVTHYTGAVLQWVFLTEDGQGMAQRRTEHATEVLKKARQEGKLHYQNHLMRFFQSTSLFVVDPSTLKSESIQKISSGKQDPRAREPFNNFKDMLDLGDNTPLSWVFKQDEMAYKSRQILAKLMKPNRFSELDAITERQLQTELKTLKNPPEGFCLYQWVHQLTMTIIAEHVLGITYFPSYAHAVLDKAEVAVVRETKSFNVLGYNIAVTSSQQRYLEAKQDFIKLANELVEKNIDDILNGTGYLSQVLQELAAEKSTVAGKSIPLTEVLQDKGVKKILSCAAAGLLFASGTLSTSLTIGLLYLDQCLLNTIQSGATYWEAFWKESLRYTSSAAHNLRLASAEMTLETSAGALLRVPKNSFIVMDHRRSHQNPATWRDPENFRPQRFMSDDTPQLNTSKFSPFSLGERMCPGRLEAERIFQVVIAFLIKHKIAIRVLDPKFKDINDNQYWTNEDFVTRLRSGLKIHVQINIDENNCTESQDLGIKIPMAH